MKRMRNCQSLVSLAREAEMSWKEKQAAQEQRSRARQDRQAPMSRGDGERTTRLMKMIGNETSDRGTGNYNYRSARSCKSNGISDR